METGVYVDVLLVVNYVVNVLLISCTAKIAGRKARGRRIVAAALLGSVSSLTIFLPFIGFFVSLLLKLAVSAAVVLTAFRWLSAKAFFKELFLFFAVSFSFAGVMLGIWMAFRPKGMLYYNGIVYFDISAMTLMLTTVIAYGVLELISRLTRAGRIKTTVYQTFVCHQGRTASLKGLVDTGNSLREPFSGYPVMVCSLETAAPALPAETVEAISNGAFQRGEDCGIPLRSIPYTDVGGGGMLPAFRPDYVQLGSGGPQVRNVYVAISPRAVGGEAYDCILNPDMACEGLEIRSISK